MLQYNKKFKQLLKIKSKPNNHEIDSFERGKKYIEKLSKIPGIEMIAIVNSLSMYATHDDSDIDLFVITQPGMIWFVRFFMTLLLWKNGVWRKGEDIAGNFCLSFFITTEAMNLSKIAIENDIYLYYWIYYMKPIYTKNNTYEKFLQSNTWVEIDGDQKIGNQMHIMSSGGIVPQPIVTNETSNLSNRESLKLAFYKNINQIIRYFLLPKTLNSQKRLGNPEGIIISDSMLKFHNQDTRYEIRDTILKS